MRQCGVLMPLFSLPGPYGVGGFGRSAYEFVDFLAAAGQQVWQLLPLAPTGFGDSPYHSCSAFASTPYFIALDELRSRGILEKGEYEALAWGGENGRVDYGALYRLRWPVLRRAAGRFFAFPDDDYYAFCFENEDWLEDYALYMAAKGENGMKSWLEWPEALRRRQSGALEALRKDRAQEIGFWKFLQYQCHRQWSALKAYANGKGVLILGDMPIYVAADSADAWAGGEMFETDGEGNFSRVAGCPPDYFSADGQLWGNPLYDWAWHERTGYRWWARRMRRALALYDIVRIDHFRAFDTYYAIPAGEKTARVGRWEQGPGKKFFDALQNQLGSLPIVAEDLGLLFDSVRRLLADTGLPGMKVLQFAFDPGGDSEYLPHNHPENCVAYPGTHDNATLAEWLAAAPKAELAKAKRYLGLNRAEGFAAGLLRGTLASPARLAVIPMADWLGLGPEGRINTPGTDRGNWQWRAGAGSFTPELAQKMRAACALYGRCPQKADT